MATSDNRSQHYAFEFDNVAYNTTPIVPEPSTLIAAALLLVPFGASAMRVLRSRKTA